MSLFDYAAAAFVAGFTLVSVLLVVIYACFVAYKLLRRLANAADEIPNLVETNENIIAGIQKLQAIMNNLGWELAQFRILMTPQVAVNLEGGEGDASSAPRQRPQVPPFPTPEWSRYTTQPIRDAVPGDTDLDLLEQTDENLLTAQKIEELRQAGLAYDDGEQQPGVMMESD